MTKFTTAQEYSYFLRRYRSIVSYYTLEQSRENLEYGILDVDEYQKIITDPDLSEAEKKKRIEPLLRQVLDYYLESILERSLISCYEGDISAKDCADRLSREIEVYVSKRKRPQVDKIR